MARLRPREAPTFTKSEIEQMERLLKEIGEESLSQSFCDKVAKKFSRDTGRAGKPAIQWTQVQNWFQNNYKACIGRAVPSPILPKDWVATPNASIPNVSIPNVSTPNASIPNVSIPNVSIPNASIPNVSIPNASIPNASIPNASIPNASIPNGVPENSSAIPNVSIPNASIPNGVPENSSAIPNGVPIPNASIPNASIPNGIPENSSAIPKGEEIPDICKPNTVEELPDISELEFEAQSSKDGAWYDVSVFLTHRVLSSGEPEVRVRFVGFGAEEDEWVNVKKAVRERSVPLEPSECQRVKIGDLVLCFQERSDQAIYFDAHVMEIERKVHDVRGCRCLFLVRYDHDIVEEKVRLRRLCRRP